MVGTVVEVNVSSEVYVKFLGLDRVRRFHPNILRKMNKFSVNQVVRICSDESTVREIEKKFGNIQKKEDKVAKKLFLYRYSFLDSKLNYPYFPA